MLRRTFCAGMGAILAIGLAQPAAAQDKKALTVGIVSDPVTLDPAQMASFFELSVQYNIHEPLVHMTPDLKIEPGLASVATPDPLTYVFTLKPNLTFHDGAPIDAAAVKANFDRMLDPAVGSPRRSELGPVDSVEVTGPLAVTIKLKSAYAPFLQVLANRAGMMVSPAALKSLGADFATKAVGAGPYKVVSWTKNSELVLERFPGYWRGPAPIERVVFRPMADETVRVTNLRSGTVQLVDGVPAQTVGQLTREASLSVKQTDGLGFNAFSFNTTRSPFNDVKVRRAFAMAIDPTAVQKAVYFGTGAPAYGPIPPSIGWAYDKSAPRPKADPAAAKKLLADAGVTAPVAVSITVTNSPAQVRTAEVLQALANQAGFKVDVKQIDATSLITVLRQKDFDLCMSPWSGRSDPDGNMFNYFTKTGPNNFAGYSSDAVTDLLVKARGVPSQDERAKLYNEAEKQIAADAPMLFLTFPATIQASVAGLDWMQYPDGALRLQFAKFK
ncbi:ABC transporter substrate-binding protein [Alsobacter metallidurans]|uniref:ABC transporter substrate-binding protein n=1 Tax=Alsobacter metallidurans TaxID=340221 RepID=A0A917I7L4_9HYPH|nr:ABC transporter substrate-binding protein [Alsobacter metallidurans]GGH19372.1 ABC transporter substrate-binding protein [Alsobacter metallidurans]